MTDSWGYETAWELRDYNDNLIASVDFGEYEGNTYYSHSYCLDTTCYTFTIYDNYGDGILSPGGYRVSYDGHVICDNLGSGWIGYEESCGPFGDCRGACCDEFDSECTDNVDISDCEYAFYANRQCVDILCSFMPHCVEQNPNGDDVFFSDIGCGQCGGQQFIAENFELDMCSFLYTMAFWGGYHPGDNDMDPDVFTIIFRDVLENGTPGEVLYSLENIPADEKVQSTEPPFWYRYIINLDFEPSLSEGSYYVEVYNNTSDYDFDWFWGTGDLDPEAGIEGRAWSTTSPEEPWNYDSAFDMSLVLDCDYVGSPCGDYVIGDYNGNREVNVADVVDLFSRLKTGAPVYPEFECDCIGNGNMWAVSADVNSSCTVNVADVVALHSKLRTGEPELVPCLDCPPDCWEPSPGCRKLPPATLSPKPGAWSKSTLGNHK